VRRLYAVGEGSEALLPFQGRMRAWRWDQGLVGGWTAASVRPLLQLLSVRLWSYQLSRLSPRLTVRSRAGLPRVAALVLQSRRRGIGASGSAVSLHVVTNAAVVGAEVVAAVASSLLHQCHLRWLPPLRWRSFRPCHRLRPGQILSRVETTPRVLLLPLPIPEPVGTVCFKYAYVSCGRRGLNIFSIRV
jgi:hypothetical protein